MYRRLSADRLFIMGENVVRKTFFCVWFLSGEVTCAPLHPREAWSGHLKSEDVPPNSSAIIYYSSWLLEANPQSLIGGFHWCEELSVPSLWDLQQCFLIETRFVWFISCFEADQRDLSNMQHRLIVLLYAVWACLVTFQRPALNQEELWKFTRTWDIIFLVRTWCLLSTELWFGVWCALQLVDNSLQRRWAATGGINK